MLKEKYEQLLRQQHQLAQGGNGEKVSIELLFELDKVKESEAEAREELLITQKFMRMQRLFLGFKDGVKQSKHDFKVDNLKQQLTSNS